jgi:hypothetical protein
LNLMLRQKSGQFGDVVPKKRVAKVLLQQSYEGKI